MTKGERLKNKRVNNFYKRIIFLLGKKIIMILLSLFLHTPFERNLHVTQCELSLFLVGKEIIVVK